MDDELDYLWETLGLEITAIPWPDRHKIHPTLRPAITVMQATYRGASFLMMRMAWHAALPDLKRVQASLVELSGIPVVISETHLEQRQRDRLQAQRIPFICPGIQAYLPFMDEEYWSGKPNKQVKIYDRISGHSSRTDRSEPAGGKRIPEFALRTRHAFRSCYSSASAQVASLKPGIAKSSPTSSGRLTSMPSVANSS